MEIKDPKHFFYVCNGTVLKNLDDLMSFLKSGDQGSFYYHVNEDKNDFSCWINDILKEKALSKKISKVNSPEDMIKILKPKTGGVSFKKNKKKIISEIKSAVFHG
jgi:hypothetical protein